MTTSVNAPAIGATPSFVPTTIRDAFGVLKVDAQGQWRFHMACPAAHRAEPGTVLTRNYDLPLSDGSSVTLTLPVGLPGSTSPQGERWPVHISAQAVAAP